MIKEEGNNISLNSSNMGSKNAEIPKNWKNANVIFLYEKGEYTNFKNDKWISLLAHIYTVLTKIITNRLNKKLYKYQPHEHFFKSSPNHFDSYSKTPCT